MMNENLIVDLLPAHTETDFARIYRCTPRQFITILRRMREDKRDVYINLRDFDGSPDRSSLYVNAHEGIGTVLAALAEHDFSRVYLNTLRRNAVFHIFQRQSLLQDSIEVVREYLGAHIHELLQRSDSRALLRQFPELMVRGGGVAAPEQAIIRIAYHLAFSSLCSGTIGQSGIPLDPFFESLMDNAERGRPIQVTRLADAIHRATKTHHKYTASITGAYGGSYNIEESELRVSNTMWQHTPIGDSRTSVSRGFLDFAYNLRIDRFSIDKRLFKNVLEIAPEVSFGLDGHLPSPKNIDLFFDNMEPVRAVLKSQRLLKRELDKIIGQNKRPEDDATLNDYILAAEKHVRSSRSALKEASKVISIGNVGAATSWFGTSSLLSVAGSTAGVATAGVTSGVTTVAAAPALIALALACATESGREFLQNSICSIFCQNEDEKQVGGFNREAQQGC